MDYLCCPALWFQGIGFGSDVYEHAAADWKNGSQDLSAPKIPNLCVLELVFVINFQKLHFVLMLLVLCSAHCAIAGAKRSTSSVATLNVNTT